jgi:hypothetical protein
MSPRKSPDTGTDTDVPPVAEAKEQKVPGMRLQAGERLIVVGRPGMAACWYKYLFTLGLYQIWHKRDLSVLTDRRVFTGRGVMSREEHSTRLRTSIPARTSGGACVVIATSRRGSGQGIGASGWVLFLPGRPGPSPGS